MVIGIILGIILAALIVACVVWNFCAADNGNGVMRTIASVLAVVFVFAFILVPFSFHQVDTGEIAVVKHLGEAKDIKTAGVHYDFWVTNKYVKYDAKVQNLDIATAAYSADAQTMDIQMTLQYQIVADKVLEITNQYGSLEILQNRIQSVAIEKAKAALSEHKAMDIIANRAQMSPVVEESIRNAIGENYYVNVTAVVLTNIDFSDAFEQAVEQKMIAEQNKLKADYENETKVAQAEADAKAKIVTAEAEAKANELLEKSLTDKILREMYIDKWDGKLPSVVSDGSIITDITGNGNVQGE